MIRVQLTETERAAVRALRRDKELAPAERDRVEMVLLSDAGWSAPRIAGHLGYCAAAVRATLKRFGAAGTAGLRRGRPGPPKDAARRAEGRGAARRRTRRGAPKDAARRAEGRGAARRRTRRGARGSPPPSTGCWTRTGPGPRRSSPRRWARRGSP